jgi:hypothetical protein
LQTASGTATLEFGKSATPPAFQQSFADRGLLEPLK